MLKLILVALIILIVWWISNVVYSTVFSPLRHLPSPWIYQLFPVYFHLRLAMGDSPQVIHACFLKHGKVFRVGWDKVLFVDGQAALDMYSTYRFAKSPLYEAFSYFGQNLISLQERSTHALRKRILQPAFTKPSIAAMQPKIIQAGVVPLLQSFERASDNKSSLDIYHHMHYYAWDVVGILAFGESFRMLKEDTHREAIEWMYGVLQFGLNRLAFPFLNYFKSVHGEKLRKFSHWVIERYYNRLDSDRPVDIIGHFVLANENHKFTLDEILSETFVQLFGATDTVANALTWFIYLVHTHPNVESELVKELDSFGLLNPGHILMLEHVLDKLPYFEATLKETLRYYPVVANIPLRTTPEGGASVMGIHLPAGTKVGIPMFSLHRSPLAWDKPYEFVPERWLNSPTPKEYIPFLLGPRGCIGKNLAWAQLHLVCANILANYKLTLMDPSEGKETTAPPILRPKSGKLNILVERRC